MAVILNKIIWTDKFIDQSHCLYTVWIIKIHHTDQYQATGDQPKTNKLRFNMLMGCYFRQILLRFSHIFLNLENDF